MGQNKSKIERAPATKCGRYLTIYLHNTAIIHPILDLEPIIERADLCDHDEYNLTNKHSIW
jgi:hypothetical protein